MPPKARLQMTHTCIGNFGICLYYAVNITMALERISVIIKYYYLIYIWSFFVRKNIFIVFILIIFLSLKSYSNTNSIIILHMNDTHSYNEEFTEIINNSTNVYGGAARIKSYIDFVRENNGNVIILHAGDTITGSAFSSVYKGMDELEIMNNLGVNAVAIGNHEFDYGIKNLDNIIKKRKFPTLSANIKYKKNDKLYSKAYMVTNIGGLKIAIIGISTSDKVYEPSIYKDLIIEDEIYSLTNLLNNIPLNKTNDITVLLSHAGYEKDIEIAKTISNTFNIIVGGHSHTKLERPVYINNTAIVQAGSYGKYIGKIYYEDGHIKNYNLQTMDKSIAEDINMLKIIDSLKKKISIESAKKIADITLSLSVDDIRIKSTPLGNFLSDLVLDYYNGEVDAVFMTAGGIRRSLNNGEITLSFIINDFYPFESETVIFSVKGKTLKKMIEVSISKKSLGGFSQFSRGIKIIVNKDNTFLAYLNGKPIEDGKDYRLAINSFAFSGGDGYENKNGEAITKNAKNVIFTGIGIRDIIATMLEKYKKITPDMIDFSERIIFE